MTVVVADTSPLNYLALIELIDVLPRLYGTVVIPQDVLSELTSPAAPHEVRQWAKTSEDPSRLDRSLGQLIDLPSALSRLLATNFRVSISLTQDLLAEDAERKGRRAE